MIETVEIFPQDELYRRVRPEFHIKKNGKLTSQAFRLREGENGLSVDLARLTTPERTLGAAEGDFRLAVLTASVPMEMGLSVCHDPNPPEEPENDAHTLIKGPIDIPTRQALAAACRLQD